MAIAGFGYEGAVMAAQTGVRAAVKIVMANGAWLDFPALCKLLPSLTSKQISNTIRHMGEENMLEIDKSAGGRRLRYRLKGVAHQAPVTFAPPPGDPSLLARCWTRAGERVEANDGI